MNKNFKKLSSGNYATPVGRASYPNVFKPMVSKKFPNSDPKYSIDLMFPKSLDMTELKEIIKAKATEKWGKDIPNGIRLPKIVDGDMVKTKTPAYAGHWVVKFTTGARSPVGVVNLHGETIVSDTISEEGFYGGCYAQVTFKAYAYEGGVGGIGLDLANVRKIRDGEPFGTPKAEAVDEFSEAEVVEVGAKASATESAQEDSAEESEDNGKDPFAELG